MRKQTPNIKTENSADEAGKSSPFSTTLLLKMAASIFIAEMLIMFLLQNMPPIHPMIEALIDSALLSFIVLFCFYFFVSRSEGKTHVNRDAGNKISYASITFKYLLALGIIAVLSFAGYLGLYKAVVQGKGSAEVINTSGRQRMLAQRVAMFSLILVNSKDINERNKIRKKLSAIADLFLKTHHRLASDDPYFSHRGKVPPAVRALYFEPPTLLDSRVQEFITEIKKLVDEQDDALTYDNPHFRRILTIADGELLDSFDTLAELYQKDSEKNISRILYLAYRDLPRVR